MHSRNVCIKLNEPVVSFTFDDVPRSAVVHGEAILKKYNYSGTYYISAELMRKSGFDFDQADSLVLQEIIKSGGELACHTFSHLHFFKSNRDRIIADLEKNQEFIQKYIAGYKFDNFSYPYGAQTAAARSVIKNKFRSGRSVYKGINVNKTDLNCLKAIRLYESISPVKIVEMINRAIQVNGWIIFYTHDVEQNPSKNGCSPEYFETIVRYCVERKLKVLPVNKVLDMILK